MLERLDKCPSCGHPQFNTHLICVDHSVSHESFSLQKCEECHLVFTNPRPSLNQIGAYYLSDSYISHTNRANNLVNRMYKIIRSIALKNKLTLLEGLTKKRQLLDFGCGTGHFLDFCQNHGWNISGVEPDLQARTLAESKLRYPIESNLHAIKQTFDVITAWHVIEHVHNLNETIRQLSCRMNENGFLIIALPNCNSFDATHYQQHWAGYDVPRHLYHFTKKSFSLLAAKHNLELIDCLPMKFDAYYVSLLSEKYISRKNNLLKAFSTGRKSNALAKKTSEYSSLIYILSK